MAGERGGAAGKRSKAAGDEPAEPTFHWLVLGTGDDEHRFALKPQMPTYLLGKLFAAKSLGDILELQAKVLQKAVDDTDAEALDEFLESGAVEPEDAVQGLFDAYSERPTPRSEHISGGASSTATETTSPMSSPSSDPGDSPPAGDTASSSTDAA
jgi:hypothetical protein